MTAVTALNGQPIAMQRTAQISWNKLVWHCMYVCVSVCVHVPAQHKGTVNLQSRTAEVLIGRWNSSMVRFPEAFLKKQAVCSSKRWSPNTGCTLW